MKTGFLVLMLAFVAAGGARADESSRVHLIHTSDVRGTVGICG